MQLAAFLKGVALATALLVIPGPIPPSMGLSAQALAEETALTGEERAAAERAVARFCKILVTRMEGVISDEWAIRDLQELAKAWDSLECHRLAGIEERVRAQGQ